jgi:hypothetical protein
VCNIKVHQGASRCIKVHQGASRLFKESSSRIQRKSKKLGRWALFAPTLEDWAMVRADWFFETTASCTPAGSQPKTAAARAIIRWGLARDSVVLVPVPSDGASEFLDAVKGAIADEPTA